MLNKQCYICNDTGHLSYQCPIKKKMTCRICGILGHQFKDCPNQFCYKCDEQGHHGKACRNGLAPEKRKTCRRCYMNGHIEKQCPDRWRQYYITTKSGPPKKPSHEYNIRNPRIYCYNCGKKGHFGHECVQSRMNSWISPSTPFIFRFDNYLRPFERRGNYNSLSNGHRNTKNMHIRFDQSPVEYNDETSKRTMYFEENNDVANKRFKLAATESESIYATNDCKPIKLKNHNVTTQPKDVVVNVANKRSKLAATESESTYESNDCQPTKLKNYNIATRPKDIVVNRAFPYKGKINRKNKNEGLVIKRKIVSSKGFRLSSKLLKQLESIPMAKFV